MLKVVVVFTLFVFALLMVGLIVFFNYLSKRYVFEIPEKLELNGPFPVFSRPSVFVLFLQTNNKKFKRITGFEKPKVIYEDILKGRRVIDNFEDYLVEVTLPKKARILGNIFKYVSLSTAFLGFVFGVFELFSLAFFVIPGWSLESNRTGLGNLLFDVLAAILRFITFQ